MSKRVGVRLPLPALQEFDHQRSKPVKYGPVGRFSWAACQVVEAFREHSFGFVLGVLGSVVATAICFFVWPLNQMTPGPTTVVKYCPPTNTTVPGPLGASRPAVC